MMFKTALTLASAQLAAAHFGLVYPEWRADTLNAPEDSPLSQWTYPCAGADFKAGNITEWPLDGGSIQLELHHAWSYVFLNIGLGENTTDFNITLTPQLMNTTGKGMFCLDDIRLPANSNVTEGAIGTLQVVTSGESGSALYNCADIRFTANATKGPTCNNTVQHSFVQSGGNSNSSSGNNSTQSGSNDKGAAGILGVNMVSMATFTGLAVVFAMGLGM